MTSSRISIAVAGSTEHTRMCAETLIAQTEFEIPWILTPEPKHIGRQHVLTKNPMEQFADEHHLPLISLQKKVDDRIRTELERFPAPDFLLVVDFGYIVPDWLLALPSHAPLNIHPSLLPKWRGSSPGQFVLLSGEKESGISIIIMNSGLDTGDVVSQLPFSVEPGWTQTEYYQAAFQKVQPALGRLFSAFAEVKNGRRVQPVESPTPLARKLKKEDGFIPWAELLDLEQGKEITVSNQLLQQLCSYTGKTYPELISFAALGLQPWPSLWTLAPTKKGEKRMQLIELSVSEGKLIFETVKIEGYAKSRWNEVKNLF